MNVMALTKYIKNQRWLIIAILITAFILRTAWVLSIPTQPISDFKKFDRLAVSVADGKGYLGLDGKPTAYRPPGYIFFLAGIYSLFGPNDFMARLVNILLGVLSCWLTYILTIELFDKRTALIAALMGGSGSGAGSAPQEARSPPNHFLAALSCASTRNFTAASTWLPAKKARA